MSSQPDVKFSSLIKTVASSLKEEKDPETGDVIARSVETKVTLAATDLDADTMRMLAAIQGEGELVVEISRRQGALFKPAKEPKRDEAH